MITYSIETNILMYYLSRCHHQHYIFKITNFAQEIQYNLSGYKSHKFAIMFLQKQRLLCIELSPKHHGHLLVCSLIFTFIILIFPGPRGSVLG